MSKAESTLGAAPIAVAVSRLTADCEFSVTVSGSFAATERLTLARLRELVSNAVVSIALPRARVVTFKLEELDYVLRTASGYTIPNAAASVGDTTVVATLDFE